MIVAIINVVIILVKIVVIINVVIMLVKIVVIMYHKWYKIISNNLSIKFGQICKPRDKCFRNSKNLIICFSFPFSFHFVFPLSGLTMDSGVCEFASF